MKHIGEEVLKLKDRVDKIEEIIDKKESFSNKLKDIIDRQIGDTENILTTHLSDPYINFSIDFVKKQSWLEGFRAHAQLMKKIIQRKD